LEEKMSIPKLKVKERNRDKGEGNIVRARVQI
jgi:hypothetical protein